MKGLMIFKSVGNSSRHRFYFKSVRDSPKISKSVVPNLPKSNLSPLCPPNDIYTTWGTIDVSLCRWTVADVNINAVPGQTSVTLIANNNNNISIPSSSTSHSLTWWTISWRCWHGTFRLSWYNFDDGYVHINRTAVVQRYVGSWQKQIY